MAQKWVEPENRGNKKETKTSVEEGRQEKKKSADVTKLNHNCRVVGGEEPIHQAALHSSHWLALNIIAAVKL